MKYLLYPLCALLALSQNTLAQTEVVETIVIDGEPFEREFQNLSELGSINKPTSRMLTTQAAFNFILADSIVRKGIFDKQEQGYENWEATSKLMGYDGMEPVYEVRVSSSDQLPPYTCIFRFDTIGNDRRKQPWMGCQYE